jgi:hypothetical protein
MGFCLAVNGLADQNGLRMPLILQDVCAPSRCKRRAGIKAIGAYVEIALAILRTRAAQLLIPPLRLTKLSRVGHTDSDPRRSTHEATESGVEYRGSLC